MCCSLKQTLSWWQLVLTVCTTTPYVQTVLVKPGSQRGCWVWQPVKPSVHLPHRSLVLLLQLFRRQQRAGTLLCTLITMGRTAETGLLTLRHAAVNYCSVRFLSVRVCSCTVAPVVLKHCSRSSFKHVSCLRKFTAVLLQLCSLCWQVKWIVLSARYDIDSFRKYFH